MTYEQRKAILAMLLREQPDPGPIWRGNGQTITLAQRLDRIEARQLLLYEKLAGIRSPLTGPARHDLIEEWNMAGSLT